MVNFTLAPIGKLASHRLYNERQSSGVGTPADLKNLAMVLSSRGPQLWDYAHTIPCRLVDDTPGAIDDATCIVEFLTGNEPPEKPFALVDGIVADRRDCLRQLLAATSGDGFTAETILRHEIYFRAWVEHDADGAPVKDDSGEWSMVRPELALAAANRRCGLHHWVSAPGSATVVDEWRVALLEACIAYALQDAPGPIKDGQNTGWKGMTTEDALTYARPRAAACSLDVATYVTHPSSGYEYLMLVRDHNGLSDAGKIAPSESDLIQVAWRAYRMLPAERKTGDLKAFGNSFGPRGTALKLFCWCYLASHYLFAKLVDKVSNPSAVPYRPFGKVDREVVRSLYLREKGGKDLDESNEKRKNDGLAELPALNNNPAPIIAYLTTGEYLKKPASRMLNAQDVKTVAGDAGGEVGQLLKAVANGDKDTVTRLVSDATELSQITGMVPAELRKLYREHLAEWTAAFVAQHMPEAVEAVEAVEVVEAVEAEALEAEALEAEALEATKPKASRKPRGKRNAK